MTKTEPFEAWELPARIALGDRGIGYHAANPIIADVKAHCAYTGQSPHEAFGEPKDFAATTAAEQPAELLEKVDRDGSTATDHLTGQLFSLALITIPAALMFAVIDRTLFFPATTAALTGTLLLIVALFAARGVPQALRASGRPQLVKFSVAAAVMFGLLAATAYTTLPREQLFRIPVLAIVAAALITLGLLTRAPKKPAATLPHTSPTPRTARPAGVEAWLTRLTGLLIGRYDLPPDRAGELAREARAHLADSGGTPEQEFGPVEDYALRLAEHEPARKEPFWRTRTAEIIGRIASIALCASVLVQWAHDGIWWAALLIALPVTLASAWTLLQTLRRR